MYATAHRVLSARGREGINAFLHVHGRDFPWPMDAGDLPEVDPGRLDVKVISITPGGNSVRAYLDILAPDETSSQVIFEALDRLVQRVDEVENPVVVRDGGVTIRFGVEAGLLNKRKEQFRNLIVALRPLLTGRTGL